MAEDFDATVYFIVGYFSKEDKERRDRSSLLGSDHYVQSRPLSQVAVTSGPTTIYKFDTSVGELDVSILKTATTTGHGSAQIVRMSTGFVSQGKTPQQAFDDYMQSADGQGNFSDATHVQMYSVNLTLTAP
jgi:hypothetical protein